jgi:putative ribosome biogenesis GTPase RsgA
MRFCDRSAFPSQPDITAKKTYLTASHVLIELQNGHQILSNVIAMCLCFVGGAGVGKSFTLNAVVSALTALGRRVAVTASTGAAAPVSSCMGCYCMPNPMLKLHVN